MINSFQEWDNYWKIQELLDYGSLEEVSLGSLPEVNYQLDKINFNEWKLDEPSYREKVFKSWQEALIDLMQNTEEKTLQETSDIARKVLESIRTENKPSSKEKLFREHLETLKGLGA